MRIAQFTESYRPVINGVAVAVDLLVETWEGKHEVEVFAARYPGYADARPTHRFPSWFWPYNRDYPLAIPISPGIQRAFRKAAFDVVHTHSPFALGGIGRRWAREAGVPVVTTYHTLYVEYAHYARGFPRGAVRDYLQRLSRAYCDSVDAVVVPTRPIAEVLRGYGVRTPIHVIPTGLKLRPPLPRSPEYPRAAFGIPAEAPLALYAGRLAREKNLPLLFSAFGRVVRDLPEARLLVCGGGPLADEARRMASEAGAGERVVFAGAVPPERMAEVYAAADVFAFASLTDTQGLVITEAKAAGVPAVAVSAYGPSEVVTDGVDGFLVENHAEAFAAALKRLLGNAGLRARMRESALREAQRYSIEATAAAYEGVYEEVRGGRTGDG